MRNVPGHGMTVCYFAPGMGVKYCDEYVCLSVCLENSTAELHQIFSACSLWLLLIPPLMALRYVMYFQFYR